MKLLLLWIFQAKEKRTTSGANWPFELAKAARELMRHTHITTGVTVDDLLVV